jgi:hypothetical protein
MTLEFEGSGKALGIDARRLLAFVWRDCTGLEIPAALAGRIVAEATDPKGVLSYRRLLQIAERELLLKGQTP